MTPHKTYAPYEEQLEGLTSMNDKNVRSFYSHSSPVFDQQNTFTMLRRPISGGQEYFNRHKTDVPPVKLIWPR